MTQSQPTRSIIDTHRHIFGPKLRQKFVENIGFDDSKPLPQANAGEMFFYRESVDVDYSMEIQQKSGVTLCVNSRLPHVSVLHVGFDFVVLRRARGTALTLGWPTVCGFVSCKRWVTPICARHIHTVNQL